MLGDQANVYNITSTKKKVDSIFNYNFLLKLTYEYKES